MPVRVDECLERQLPENAVRYEDDAAFAQQLAFDRSQDQTEQLCRGRPKSEIPPGQLSTKPLDACFEFPPGKERREGAHGPVSRRTACHEREQLVSRYNELDERIIGTGQQVQGLFEPYRFDLTTLQSPLRMLGVHVGLEALVFE